MCDWNDLLMLMLSNFRWLQAALCGGVWTDGSTALRVRLPCVFTHIATKVTPDTSI